MTIDHLDKLAALVKQERSAILSRWREQARELPSARRLDIPTLNDHMPVLLEELARALQAKSDQTIPAVLSESSAPVHGLQRLQDAFDIQEVVAEYNILRGCIHDLAEDNGLNLQGKPFHTINLVFDYAIGFALKAYAAQRELEVQRRREEYLAFVVHDLRTPLMAISLVGRILEQTLPKRETSDGTADVLKALRRSVKQLEEQVAKVLEENANLQSELGIKLEKREFDLWPMVEGLIHDLRPVAGTSGTALMNKVPDELVVYADAGLLRRIFQNLIANAIKYTPGGKVVIEAREGDAEGVVEILVSDNGAGIPEEFLDKVFDRGVTDPEKTDGMGLGLAIVKTFTEAHGGKVTVESKPGVGSTFRVLLPTKATASGFAKR